MKKKKVNKKQLPTHTVSVFRQSPSVGDDISLFVTSEQPSFLEYFVRSSETDRPVKGTDRPTRRLLFRGKKTIRSMVWEWKNFFKSLSRIKNYFIKFVSLSTKGETKRL